MHNLQEDDKQWGLEQAWHGLTVIPESGSLERDEVFPYEVIEEPLMRDGKPHFDVFTPVCSDTNKAVGDGPCLHKSSYSLYTPKDTWDLLGEMMVGTDHTFVSAGTVGNRSRFFISIKLAGLDSVNIAGREFKFYLNAISSLDKSIPLVFVNSSICTVCENTLLANFFMKSWFKHVFKHTKNMARAIESFKVVLDETFGIPALFEVAMEEFANTSVKEETARNIFTGALASKDAEKNLSSSRYMSTRLANGVDRHMELFYTGRGNGGGTLVDVLSAYTENRSRTDDKDPKKIRKIAGGDFDLSDAGASSRKASFARDLYNVESRNLLEKRGKNLQSLLIA